jgi:hypothetical protein
MAFSNRQPSERLAQSETGKMGEVAAPSGKLVGAVEPVAGLSPADRQALWALFAGYYADVTPALFERDLLKKQDLIVLRDGGDRSLRGFSTIEVYERSIDAAPFVAVFTGDTIVEEAYWGQNALQRTFFGYLVKLKLRHPFTPVHWFLISKGYKTYLLLARNLPDHYPRHDRPTPKREQAILDVLCRDKFGDAYHPEDGVLRFSVPQGRLKDGVAPIDAELLALPDVRFFVQRNPGHAKGEELCCLGTVNAALLPHFVGRQTIKTLRATVRRLWALATAPS